MGRSTKLLVSVLLVLCGMMTVVAGVLADQANTFTTFIVIALAFAVPGLALMLHTALAGIPSNVGGRVAMSFSWAALGTGVALAVASIAIALVGALVMDTVTKGMILVPTLCVPIGLLMAARAWAPKCARCDARLTALGQFHVMQASDREHAKRGVQVGDPVLLARVLAAAQRGVAMNEATASPLVIEACARCSAVAMVQLGGATAWFLDGNCRVVLNAARGGR